MPLEVLALDAPLRERHSFAGTFGDRPPKKVTLCLEGRIDAQSILAVDWKQFTVKGGVVSLAAHPPDLMVTIGSQ